MTVMSFDKGAQTLKMETGLAQKQYAAMMWRDWEMTCSYGLSTLTATIK